MADPLVSVLVICFNQEQFIQEALISTLEQDYSELEVVVADDASTDATRTIIAELAKKYPARLRPLLGEKNLGITGNSNRGLSVCKGKYIAMMGGDDVLLPGKISAQVAWLEEDHSRALCGHDVEWIDFNGNSLSVTSSQLIPMSSGCNASGIIRYGPPFAATSIMFRSNRVPEYGFHPRLPVISDWKMWIDIVGRDGCYGYIDGCYAKYRRHDGNVTANYNYRLFRDQLMTCFLSLYSLKGHYLIQWAQYFFDAVLRRVFSRAKHKEFE